MLNSLQFFSVEIPTDTVLTSTRLLAGVVPVFRHEVTVDPSGVDELLHVRQLLGFWSHLQIDSKREVVILSLKRPPEIVKIEKNIQIS